MTEYYVAASANFFRVKDRSSFLAWAQTCALEVWEGERNGSKCFSIFTNDEDEGDEFMSGKGWPSQIYDEETGKWTDVNFYRELARHLQDGSVAVLTEAGRADADSPFGFAMAVNSKGEEVRIDLEDIYTQANRLGEVIREEH